MIPGRNFTRPEKIAERSRCGPNLLGGKDSGFVGGNELVAYAAPTDAFRNERAEEIDKVEEGNEDTDGDVDPGLGVDLRAIGWEQVGDGDDAKRASKGGEEQGKKC